MDPISINTVPETSGVINRRSRERRAMKAAWIKAEHTAKEANRAGPPETRAATETARNGIPATIIRG